MLDSTWRMMMTAQGQAATPIDVTFLGSFSHGTGSNPRTLSNVSIGEARPDRLIVGAIGIGIASTNSRSLNSATFGGVSAEIIVSSLRDSFSGSQQWLAMAAAIVPTGETTNLVFNYNTTTVDSIAVFKLTGVTSATPHDLDAFVQPLSREVSLQIPSGGVGIIFPSGGGDGSVIWTVPGFDEIFQSNTIGSTTQLISSSSSSGTVTPQVAASASPSRSGVIAVSWSAG